MTPAAALSDHPWSISVVSIKTMYVQLPNQKTATSSVPCMVILRIGLLKYKDLRLFFAETMRRNRSNHSKRRNERYGALSALRFIE
jgi:hypothetical protein